MRTRLRKALELEDPLSVTQSRSCRSLKPPFVHIGRYVERFGVEIIAGEATFLSYGKFRQQQQGPAQDNEDDDIPS